MVKTLLLLVFTASVLILASSAQLHCTRPNEIYMCGSPCDTVCARLGQPCPIVSTICINRCYCKRGFARDANGTCIPIDRCPELNCTRPNEIYMCGSPCDTVCARLGQPCPIVSTICINRCYCKREFARDANGTCIPIDSCPELNCTRPNEIYMCGSPCDTVCARLGQPCPIVSTICINRCYCKRGFARDANGTCIPIDRCPDST